MAKTKKETFRPLTADEEGALRRFAADAGHGWKHDLSIRWHHANVQRFSGAAGADPVNLYILRHLGLRWLEQYKLPGVAGGHTPTCSKCGAITAPAGPVIPMIQPTRPPRLPWTQPLWRDTPQPTVPWGPPLAEDPFPDPPAFPDLPPWGSSGDVWCAVDHTVRHNVERRS